MFLIACGPKDLPESPGTPGAATMAGRAGIFLPSGSMPSWTRPPTRDFSMKLTNAKIGEVQEITYGNPLATKEYATWWKMYYYLDGNWIPVEAVDKEKVRDTRGWLVSEKATWKIPITEQFKPLVGEQKTVYVVLYTCSRSGQQWDCGKWIMDLFKVGTGVESPAEMPVAVPEDVQSPNYTNQESRSQSITAYAVKDIESNKQYAVLVIAVIAILIITSVNFIKI
ncbi:hypothetical protein KY329_04060 [Candidatus Woesearchaeota archaeon]|nr:hypothetical protein [Candidatus Woesearchaeota archaeon]